MRMMLGFGSAAVLLVAAGVSAPAVQAASFDCAKAASQVEQAICANPTLGRADEVLARAYATALGGLGETAKATIQADQRQWLDFAALACTVDAQPFSVPLSGDQQTCLAMVYRDRVSRLSESGMEGEWRVYPRSSYSLVDDPDPDAYEGVATKDISSPRIDEDTPVAVAFNALMDAADRAAAPDPKAEDYQTSDVAVTTRVDSVGSQRISLATTTYWMGHGAAHGNYAITHAHYLTEPMRMLVATDLFAGEGWQEVLGRLVLNELDQSVEGGIWDDARANVPAMAAEPSRWSLEPEGLKITFQPYEVTAYAAGAPPVTIRWDQLYDHLAPGHANLLY